MSFSKISKKAGEEGEKIARSFIKNILSNRNYKLMQLDWIAKVNNKVIVFEVKTQEQYINPSGHGLPPWQIKSRLELLKLFKFEALFFLIVICLTEGYIYSLDIDKDWESKGFYTKSKNRFIFPIHLFKKHDLLKEEIEKLKTIYNIG
jgi:hypothetical protein